MPSLIELGREAGKSHYEIGKKIGEICDYIDCYFQGLFF
jgi:hypothetical protein